MTCDPRQLSYYRDGALSPDERYEVESHLRECSECAASLRGLMRLAQVVRSLPMEPVSPTLRENVYRLVALREQERRRPLRLAGIGRTLAPAAIAASIVVSSLVAFRPGALDLASQPAAPPVAVTAPASVPTVQEPPVAQAPARQPDVQGAQAGASQPSASSARASDSAGQVSASAPATSSGGHSLAPVAPPVHVPVSESNPGSLPVKIANPATVPAPIARLYNSNRQVHDLLGEASPGSRTVTLLEQSFQGGLAIWRSDTREIYVLRREGNSWTVHPDTWRPGDEIAVDGSPPPGAMVPSGGFASVWGSTPEVKSRLGWAVYEPRGSGGAIQAFEHGLIVWTPHGLLYVLSNDGRWRTFPDASPL